jgi:hypothetical protein
VTRKKNPMKNKLQTCEDKKRSDEKYGIRRKINNNE